MSLAGPDILGRIAEAVRRRLADEAPPADLERRAREAASRRRSADGRSLRAALEAPGVRVIAECKRRSPSQGWLREPFDPVALARAYEAGGACAVSVVTEREFFAGDPEWVPRVRRAVRVPVLRKDFLLAPRQLWEASVLGADAVLLIARALPGAALAEMLSLADELGLETLVEVHDADDLERVLDGPAPIVGINARDLASFAVDLDGAARLAARVPGERVAVLESGIRSAVDVRRLAARGFRRFLIGTCLVAARDPQAALREMLA